MENIKDQIWFFSSWRLKYKFSELYFQIAACYMVAADVIRRKKSYCYSVLLSLNSILVEFYLPTSLVYGAMAPTEVVLGGIHISA